MQIGDRVSIKRKVLTFHDQEPVIQDSPVLATVTSVHAPFSFAVKYDQPQDDCDYREIPFQAIPETVRVVSEIRDTQFAGFAKLLMQEMIALRGYIDIGGYTDEDALSSANDYTEIIARRAYDLAEHTVGYCLGYLHECGYELSGSMNMRLRPSIPDMTAWPEKNT